MRNRLNKILTIRLSDKDIKKIDLIIQYWEQHEEFKPKYSRSDVIRTLLEYYYNYIYSKNNSLTNSS